MRLFRCNASAALALWLFASIFGCVVFSASVARADGGTAVAPSGALSLLAAPSRAWGAVTQAARGAKALTHPATMWPLMVRPLPTLTVDPVDGELSSPYGFRRDPIHRRRKHHNGIDFVATRGADVRAVSAGVVVRAERYRGYGRVVFIDHGNGLESRYAHLQRIHVKEGDTVTAAELIGAVGSSGRATGPHLHFEIRVDGVPIPPERVMSTSLVPQRRTLLQSLADVLMLRHWPGISG